MSEADRLVQVLREAGRPDSTGTFTTDPERALEMLGRYALPDPERYVVHLVEAATLGGATWVAVRADADSCRLEFDGEPISEADLRRLLPVMAAGGWATSHRFHPLALAVVSAPGSVEVRSSGVCARFVASSLEVEPRDPSELTEIVLRRPARRPFWRRPPEHGMLRQHCPHAPPALRIGRSESKSVQPPACLVYSRLVHPKADLEVRAPQHLLQRREQCPAPFSVALTLGWPVDVPPLRVLHAGRTWPVGVDLGPTVTAVVSFPALRTDLVRSNLIGDAAWEEMVSVLRAEGGRMRLEVEEGFSRLPPHARPWAAPHLLALCRERSRAGSLREALKPALLLAEEALPDTRHAAAVRYRLAVLLQACSEPREARREVVLALRRAAPGFRVRLGDETDEPLSPFVLEGRPEDLRDLQAWLVAVEQSVLPDEHPLARARAERLERFCRDSGLPRPARTWSDHDLGG